MTRSSSHHHHHHHHHDHHHQRQDDDYKKQDRSCSPPKIDDDHEDQKIIPYELRRNAQGQWDSIKVGSLDWRQSAKQHPHAVVVRVSAIISAEIHSPEQILKHLRKHIGNLQGMYGALHVVCMFKEFAVSEISPVRFTSNFWFIFPSLEDHDQRLFDEAIRQVLPPLNISYVTMEMLGSFLYRREYESRQISKAEAIGKMKTYLSRHEPCSSLFLKMSPECPDLCRQLLADIPRGEAIRLVGVRAVHKLAVSCTSSHMSTHHNYNETMNVMKMGIHSEDWSFVVYKTLMRLATKNDRSRRINPMKRSKKSHISEMLNLVDNSNLRLGEKIAIRLIARDYRCPPSMDETVNVWVDFMCGLITNSDDYAEDSDFDRLFEIIDDGSPATCHLTGVLLEKCVEQENFHIGWRIASTVLSVNEHTIEEIVTLCSKAFFKFSRIDKGQAEIWFGRVHWCVERHYKLLGKYPSGLALHVAAHRGDFELCWRWYVSKKEEKAFRFGAHHTSSIFKAATYSKDPEKYMDKVLEAYKMTSQKEKSPFVFEPLYHLWGMTSSECKQRYHKFWKSVHNDLNDYLKKATVDDDNSSRKVKKLSNWEKDLREWRNKNGGRNNLNKQKGRSKAHKSNTWSRGSGSGSGRRKTPVRRRFSDTLSVQEGNAESMNWRRKKMMEEEKENSGFEESKNIEEVKKDYVDEQDQGLSAKLFIRRHSIGFNPNDLSGLSSRFKPLHIVNDGAANVNKKKLGNHSSAGPRFVGLTTGRNIWNHNGNPSQTWNSVISSQRWSLQEVPDQ